MMNNEQKRELIGQIYDFYMECQSYECTETDNEKTGFNEKLFWDEYKARFLCSFPKSLFKYRKPVKHNFDALENDKAWFSFPDKFDDTTDSTINNDIEAEMDKYREDSSLVPSKLAKAVIEAGAKSTGVDANINESDLVEVFHLFDENGVLNEKATETYLLSKMPREQVQEELEKIKKATGSVFTKEIENGLFSFFSFFTSINSRIRSQAITYSLAEENDNQAMWGLCADESRGFCIEYRFPESDDRAQMMLMNLLPVYYGEKPPISFFDTLANSIRVSNGLERSSINDYRSWLISSVTKNPSYGFQKEWRITLNARIAFDSEKKDYKHLQDFPFAVSVIMGERISDKDAQTLTEIAKKKGLSLFQRRFNSTGSGIIVERVL